MHNYKGIYIQDNIIRVTSFFISKYNIYTYYLRINIYKKTRYKSSAKTPDFHNQTCQSAYSKTCPSRADQVPVLQNKNHRHIREFYCSLSCFYAKSEILVFRGSWFVSRGGFARFYDSFIVLKVGLPIRHSCQHQMPEQRPKLEGVVFNRDWNIQNSE